MTHISHELMKSAIFCVGSDDLQEWVSKKLARLKSLCGGRQISAGKRFADYLWEIYRTLSSLHHELPDDGSTGFVISNANAYETAALVILICALQHEGCLQVFGLKWEKIDICDCQYHDAFCGVCSKTSFDSSQIWLYSWRKVCHIFIRFRVG